MDFHDKFCVSLTEEQSLWEIQGYPSAWDCKDDLKILKYDHLKVKLSLFCLKFFCLLMNMLNSVNECEKAA